MQGRLQDTSAGEVIANIYLSKRSGVLRLIHQEVRKNIYFVDGSIVFAHSNLRLDRLGETLLRLGKISDEEFQIASQEVIAKGKRLGQVLREKGFLSPGEVDSGVHYQLQQIVYSVFDWEDGEYEFEAKERPVFEDIMLDVSTPHLLMEGIRNCTATGILKRSYQNDEEQIVFLSEADNRLPRMDLEYAEETILACVDGRKTIHMLKNLTRLIPLEFDRAMCSLLLCGMISLKKQTAPVESAPSRVGSDSDVALRAQIYKRWSTLSTQPMQARIKTFSDEEMRKMIIETSEKFKNVTDEEVLKVLPDYTKEELQKSYDHLIAIYHPLYHAQDRFLDMKDALKYIVDRVATAYDRLNSGFDLRLPLSETPLDRAGARPVQVAQPVAETSPSAVATPQPQETTGAAVQAEPLHTISELQELLKKDPANTGYMRKLGKKLQESGKSLEAEKHLLRALELEPQNIENHFSLADLYQSLGLKIRAFKHLNIILQLQPDNERALDVLGLKKKTKVLYEISSGE